MPCVETPCVESASELGSKRAVTFQLMNIKLLPTTTRNVFRRSDTIPRHKSGKARSRKRPGPRGDSNRRAGTCHNAGWLGASWPTNQHVWLDGGEVTYCSFFDFAASKRPCLMTQRSSTKPAANARITINRIVSTPMPHAPRRVLIVTFEQENRPAM